MSKEGNRIITKESPDLLELTKELVNVAMKRVSEGPEDSSGTQRVALDLGSRVYLITKIGEVTSGGLEPVARPNGLFISGIQKDAEERPAWQLNGLLLPIHDSLVKIENLDGIKEIKPKNIEALVKGLSVAPQISVDVYYNLTNELRLQKYKKKLKSRRGRRR